MSRSINKIKNNDINGQASHYQINYGSWLNCWKIIHERFQQTAKQQGGKSANPFSEFLNQTMQAVNFTHKPMIRDEAFKILQLTAEKANARRNIKNLLEIVSQERSSKGRIIQYSTYDEQCQM